MEFHLSLSSDFIIFIHYKVLTHLIIELNSEKKTTLSEDESKIGFNIII